MTGPGRSSTFPPLTIDTEYSTVYIEGVNTAHRNIDAILGWNAPHIHISIEALKASNDGVDAPPASIRLRRNDAGGWDRVEA